MKTLFIAKIFRNVTEEVRTFYQLTVCRILVAKAASLKGGERLPCVGHCRPTAGDSWACEPSWWHLWEPLVALYLGMAKVLLSSVGGSVLAPRSEESRDSLAACGTDHAGAESHAAACGGPTLEQESVRRKEWQTDQMLPIPTLWATGSREEEEKLAKEWSWAFHFKGSGRKVF